MKYNRVSLARKKELEQPDEFIVFSQRMLALAVKYKTRIATGVGGIVAVVVIVFAVQYFISLSEDNAFTLFHDAMADYNVTATNNLSDKANAEFTEGLKAVIEKYPRTVAGNLSRVHLADLYYGSGKYDDAIKLYEDSMSYFKKSASLQNLIFSGVGYCYEAKKDYPSAIKYFEMITEGQSDLFKAEAYFNLGEIYGKMGNGDKHLEMIRNIVDNYKGSVYYNLAREMVGDRVRS